MLKLNYASLVALTDQHAFPQWLVTFSAAMYDLKANPDKKDPAPASQIWYVHTIDFKTFTEASIYLKIQNGGASDLTLKHIADDTWGAYRCRAK